MKLIHLSDLHLGKRVNGFSMLEDQQYILDRILEIVDQEKPDAVMIAGDIYDKTIPPVDAVRLLDQFLFDLSERGLTVFVISGNHDSAERLSCNSRLMTQSGVYVAPLYDGEVKSVACLDEYGSVHFYLLPFLRPIHVREAFPEEDISTWTDALRTVMNGIRLSTADRNVLITHQFVTGALRSESEEISVGGSDNVDASVFSDFDYVALGHIHRPQAVGCETIRYCGTPLKYSFSEVNHDKSVTVVDLKEKGNVSIRTVPLKPMREMKELRGCFEELLNSVNTTEFCNAYVHITLTDEQEVTDAAARLRKCYPYLMKLDYDNTRTRWEHSANAAEDAVHKTPMELFADFYYEMNGKHMDDEQESYISKFMEEILEGTV